MRHGRAVLGTRRAVAVADRRLERTSRTSCDMHTPLYLTGIHLFVRQNATYNTHTRLTALFPALPR